MGLKVRGLRKAGVFARRKAAKKTFENVPQSFPLMLEGVRNDGEPGREGSRRCRVPHPYDAWTGLLESVYETILANQLQKRELRVVRQ